MATISIGRGGAPGTFIYEAGIASQAGTASFNTVYMMVEAPDEASTFVFPFNTPIFVGSLNEYENLIGGIPTSGAVLDSYYSVKSFFQQANIGDLRVVRVGTPSNIIQIGFNPSANKDNGVSAPSPLLKNDKVYIKLEINGVRLGEVTPSGAWMGVAVNIPVDYAAGNTPNNLKISNAIRDAVVSAINSNTDISSSVYVREVKNGVPCEECSSLHIANRIFNGPVEIINSSQVTGNQFILASSGYSIETVSLSEVSVYDWIQSVRTSLDGANLPKGYLIAPAAFKKFKKVDRVNLGQTMEEVASDLKWLALVDCGPFNVTDIVDYNLLTDHNPSSGFVNSGKYLISNAIYEWIGSNPLLFTSANYQEDSPLLSANKNLSSGQRVSLKDDQSINVGVAVNTTSNTLTLGENWPSKLSSGELVVVSLFPNTPAPTPPLYTDVYTDTFNQTLSGPFYVIAKDVDTSLEANQIKLASSKVRALGNIPLDLVTAGTPQGGGLLNIKYDNPAWELEVEIDSKTSSLIESKGGSFNSLHLPGSLQKPTAEFDFRATVRQITNPSLSIFKGGLSLNYFNVSNVDTVSSTITIPNHGYSTGDLVNYYLIPSATAPSGLSTATSYYIIRIDNNSIQLATTLANANAGTKVTLTTAGTNSTTVKTPSGASAQSIITTGGDCLFFSSEHGLRTADRIYFNANILAQGSSLVFRGSSESSITTYFANSVDRNFFSLADSTSNLSAGAFVDYPSTAIATSTPRLFYKKLGVTLDGGTFTESGLIRFIRGRKYQLDVTLAVFLVKDEANVSIVAGANNPYGVAYAADVSTDLRLSASQSPVALPVFRVEASDIDDTADEITITGHGYKTGDSVVVDTAPGATLATGLTTATTYYIIRVDANTIKLAETEASAVAGNEIDLADDGTDNLSGIQFFVTSTSSPFTFQYTEDSQSEPLNTASDFAGEDNFYCVPLSTGIQANDSLENVFLHPLVETGSSQTTLYGGFVNIELIEPQATIPSSLWNFKTITSDDLVSEALRGLNSGGVPQIKVIEVGLDSHAKLQADCESYSTTAGFLAYYAPHIKNDAGLFVPPSSFVAGLAIRRYRDAEAGFRFPPAGSKYSLAGARGVQISITTAQQEISNRIGLNALRQLPGYSTVDPLTGEVFGPVFVWGSRTRVNRANATQALYQFVNTRVILNVIYGSLQNALDGQIFSVVDGQSVTFNQIRTLISNILYNNFYIPGALFGETPTDAFQVIVDERTNPPNQIEQGVVNAKVFVVPVPTLERIEIDLVRVNVGAVQTTLTDLGLQ